MSDAPDWLEQLVDDSLEGVREADVATLHLTSGHIVACDPLVYFRDAEPFALTVKPGAYKVKLGIVDEEVAYASLELGKGKIVRWEVARCPDEEDEEGWPGYGVDSGIGCFADQAVAQAFAKQEDALHDKATELLTERGADPDDDAAYHDAVDEARGEGGDPLMAIEPAIQARQWADVRLAPKSKANIIAFRAGRGEGVFASFFGLNNRGRPLRLVTDFGLLAEEEDAPLAPLDFDDDPFGDDLPAAAAGRLADDGLGDDDLGDLTGFEALAAALGVKESRQGPSPLFLQTRQLVDRWEKSEAIELAEHADRDAFAEALLEKLVSLQGNPRPGADVAAWLLDRRDVVDVYASDDDINRDLTG